MKKSALIILLMSFTQLFAANFVNSEFTIQNNITIEKEFVKYISKNERKSFYQIQVNQIKSDAERASFMEGLFASKIVVVISRTDENGILQISALNQYTTEQVKQEVEAILVASKSKPSKNVQKNK
jgi:hypothetical protein